MLFKCKVNCNKKPKKLNNCLDNATMIWYSEIVQVLYLAKVKNKLIYTTEDFPMADLNAFEKSQDTAVVDTTRKMRVAIIGTGWIADAHIEAYKKQPDVEIVAGCDLVPGKAAAFFKKHGVEGVKCDYKDGEEMVNDKSLALDAVSICTYNRQHAPCAIQALEAGVHVLLEKPFTVTTEEAIEVMRAEKKSGKILSIGFQPRLDDNMKKSDL